MLGLQKVASDENMRELEKAMLPLFLGSSITRFKGTETIEEFSALIQSILSKHEFAFPETDAPPPVDENRPIIFLDVDGVCWVQPGVRTHARYNALRRQPRLVALVTAHLDSLKKIYNFDNENEFFKIACWNPHHMQRVLALCLEFNAQIVFSSSWRNRREHKHIRALLDLWGLGPFYCGKTKDSHHSFCRSYDINDFLAANPQVKKFLILDDQYEHNLKAQFPTQYIKCNELKGFDEETFQMARCAIVDILKAQISEEKNEEPTPMDDDAVKTPRLNN